MSGSELFSQSAVLFITLFVMLVGLIANFLPIVIPGTLIMWAAALGYGLILGWDKLGWLAFSLITLLMLLGMIADFLAGHVGAKMGGASWLAVLAGAVLGFVLGLVASVVGTPLLGCVVGLMGAVGGVLWVEWRRHKDWDRAVKATKGYLAGSAAGIAAKLTSGFLMLGVFLARVYLWP
jgi:uncharacterized protein YqgC (DUF456 family)